MGVNEELPEYVFGVLSVEKAAPPPEDVTETCQQVNKLIKARLAQASEDMPYIEVDGGEERADEQQQQQQSAVAGGRRKVSAVPHITSHARCLVLDKHALGNKNLVKRLSLVILPLPPATAAGGDPSQMKAQHKLLSKHVDKALRPNVLLAFLHHSSQAPAAAADQSSCKYSHKLTTDFENCITSNSLQEIVERTISHVVASKFAHE